MVTDDSQTSYGNHFEIYRNIESLCSGSNIIKVGQLNFKNKQNHRKKDQTCGYQESGVERENWVREIKRYKFSVTK